jgi:hypothetical protein
MKARTPFFVSRKPLLIATLAGVMLSAGLAQADGRSCLFDSPASQASTVQPPVYPQDVRQQMARIEMALRNGQITPFEAGQLMRQQWDMAQAAQEMTQFQRGFMANGKPSVQAAKTGGCGLGPDLGAKLGPLVGDMAKNGMETASTVMRALMRETERLLQEQMPADKSEL